MPPKKVSPGITVILIDAGSNMSVKDTETGKSAFENAINAADWIVSRKVILKFEKTFKEKIVFSYFPKIPSSSQ